MLHCFTNSSAAGRCRLVVIGLLLLGSLATMAQTTSTIRYMTTTGTHSDPATATSWASSTTDLQGAINASQTGDQVWVAGGLYKPGGSANTDRTISFSLKNGVAIYGGFVGTETSLSQRPAVNPLTGNPSSTTLSGDIGTVGDKSDNSYHACLRHNPVTPDP